MMLLSTLLHDGGGKKDVLPVMDNLSFWIDATNPLSFNPTASTFEWKDISKPNSTLKGVKKEGTPRFNAARGGYIEYDGWRDIIDFGRDDAYKLHNTSWSVIYTSFLTSDSGNFCTCFDTRASNDHRGFSDYFQKVDGKLKLTVYTAWGNRTDFEDRLPFLDWFSFAASYDLTTNKIKYFFNGTSSTPGEYSVISDRMSHTADALHVGTSISGSTIKGGMSNVAIYKGKALTDAEVKLVSDYMLAKNTN